MVIRDKNYPYPVLGGGSVDYKEGNSFSVDIKAFSNAKQLKMEITPHLQQTRLNEMIQQCIAKLICHVECAQTAFRKVYELKGDGETDEILIPSGLLVGSIQVSPFVIAAKPIDAYENSEFGESCAGMSFPVDEGAILAVAQTIPLFVKIKNSKFAEINSPIVITVDPDEKSTCMRVDAADLIQIYLPKKMYTAYKQLDDGKSLSNIGPKVHDVLLSMVVVPALVEVLSLLGELKDEPRDVSAFSSTQWYAPVNEQVAAYAKEKLHRDVDLQTLNFLEISKLELAQHLAESPLLRGFDKLMTIGAD